RPVSERVWPRRSAIRNPSPSVTRNPSLSTTRNPSGNVKRNPAKRGQRRSARPKSKTFGHLLAASSGVDNAAEDSMIGKMTKDPAQRPAEKDFLETHNERARNK